MHTTLKTHNKVIGYILFISLLATTLVVKKYSRTQCVLAAIFVRITTYKIVIIIVDRLADPINQSYSPFNICRLINAQNVKIFNKPEEYLPCWLINFTVSAKHYHIILL